MNSPGLSRPVALLAACLIAGTPSIAHASWLSALIEGIETLLTKATKFREKPVLPHVPPPASDSEYFFLTGTGARAGSEVAKKIREKLTMGCESIRNLRSGDEVGLELARPTPLLRAPASGAEVVDILAKARHLAVFEGSEPATGPDCYMKLTLPADVVSPPRGGYVYAREITVYRLGAVADAGERSAPSRQIQPNSQLPPSAQDRIPRRAEGGRSPDDEMLDALIDAQRRPNLNEPTPP